MTFLDDQVSFMSVFGSRPILFESNLTRLDDDNTRSKMRLHVDKFMFDIFLNICKEDYVGMDNIIAELKIIHEICKNIFPPHGI